MVAPPEDRRALAYLCSQLTLRNGGQQLSNYAGVCGISTCPPRFVSSYAESRPTRCRVLVLCW